MRRNPDDEKAEEEKAFMDYRRLSVTCQDIPDAQLREGFGELITRLDIDFILDIDRIISEAEIKRHSNKCCVVRSAKSLMEQCDDFLVGHDIAWSFFAPEGPMALNWEGFYMLSGPELLRRCSNLLRTNIAKQSPESYVGVLRSLVGKAIHLSHTKSLLQAHSINQRRIERHEIQNYDHGFEFRYYMTFYYLLGGGVLDILANLLNLKYKLGCTSRSTGVSIYKTKFLDALAQYEPEFVSFCRTEGVKKWLENKKIIRDYLAHQSFLSFTSIVKEKREKVSERDLVARTRERFHAMFGEYPENMSISQARQIINMITAELKVEMDHEVLIDQAAVVPKKGGGSLIFKPLEELKNDYKYMNIIINKTLDKLNESQ